MAMSKESRGGGGRGKVGAGKKSLGSIGMEGKTGHCVQRRRGGVR